MKKTSIQKMALVAAIAISAQYAHGLPEASCEAVTKACPCNMVPVVSSKTNIKKVVKEFKKSSPRGQRSQLVGFIKQYVSKPNEITEAVMVQCARVYCDRVKGDGIYRMVQELVKAKVKKPIQAKVMLALGKVLRDSQSESCPINFSKKSIVDDRVASFKECSPTKQKTQVADLVSQYINNPTDDLEELLVRFAQVYCERVQSQVINTLIKKLIAGGDQEAVQRKIMQTLGLR